MNKPTNPNVIVPAAFALNGTKTDFSNEKIQSGFDQDAADILAGDNLNKFIDDTYKSINYSNAGVSDLYKSAVLYDGTETYYTNAIVFNVSGNNVTLYRSLADNNTGNPLTDTAKWAQVQLGADILDLVQPIGFPLFALGNTLPNANYIFLEGATVSRSTYSGLFSVYGTTYGAGDGSTTFKLPDFRNRAIWGANSFGYLSAGIPNLGLTTASNGAHSHSMEKSGDHYHGSMGENSSYGSLYGIYESGNTHKGTSGMDSDNTIWKTSTNGSHKHTINSNGAHTHTISASNSIYGASSTVQPPAIKVRVYTRWQ